MRASGGNARCHDVIAERRSRAIAVANVALHDTARAGVERRRRRRLVREGRDYESDQLSSSVLKNSRKTSAIGNLGVSLKTLIWAISAICHGQSGTSHQGQNGPFQGQR